MTATDRELCLTPTQGLAKPSKFYPAKISIPHHQLRHYISTSDGDLIYYVTNYDVFVLNLATQQSSLLATIPFEARCLAADLGWVCVGGEMNGDCAFIKVEKDEHGHPKCFGHDLVVDVLGGEIVNSMNIHTMTNDGDAPDEPIVLVSNNDRTIKIYSLAQRQVLTTLSHKVPMNFAAMSPDSQIIAAVGDCDKVHFYRRRLEEKNDSVDGYPKYDWQTFAEVVVPTGDPVYDDYSFAVAFSPSGHLCASSAQGGSITVFDMDRLVQCDKDHESSILCTFRSSRPTLWGCVRAMAFSPAPWDILAWAEDHGRIGLADVRLCFMRRQVLELDSQKVEKVELEDGTPITYRNLGIKERLKQQHLARLRAIRGSTPPEDTDTSNEESESGRRYTRQDLLSYHQGLDLDARERSVIDALETTMDNVDQTGPRPFSINYTSSPQPRDALHGYDIDLLAPLRGSSGSRSQPRRRTSVVLSESSSNGNQHLDPNNNERTRLSASPARIGEEDQTTTRSAIPPTHTSRILSGNIPPNDPWHVIQTALETARESDNSNRANLARIEAALESERRLGNQLERQLHDERQLSTLLRRQLETQQRLFIENSTQLDQLRAVARETNVRVEASLERIFQRQLASEEHFLQQRSRELQEQMTAGEQYAHRLTRERDRLLAANPERATEIMSVHPIERHAPTIRNTSLPDSLSSVLSEHSESRNQRIAHIEHLQRQVRRAESRVALATADIQALENVIRREFGRQEEPDVDSLPRRPPSWGSQNSPSWRSGLNASERNRGTISAAAARRVHERSINQNLLPDVTTRVADSDLRLARMMFLSGMSGNRATDANGNWTPGAGLHRVLAGASSLTTTGPATTTTTTTATAADAVREMGPGTAGIGFSPDGQFL